jgi:6-phosphogluconolactonase
MKKILFLFASLVVFACQSPKTTVKKAIYDMYIGTYTHKESFVDGKAQGIYHIQLDSSLSEISRSVIEGVENPSFVILSEDKKYLFCTEELNPNGFISSYNIENQEVKRLGRVSSHGGSPCHLGLNNNGISGGNYLMSANYMGGNVALFEVKNGVLSEAIDSLKFKGKGKTARQEASHPHEAVYFDKETWSIPDLGLDKIHQVEFDGKKLKKWNDKYEIEAGAGPRHFAGSRYLLNELNSTINVYYDFMTPKKLQTISTLPSDFKERNFTAEIHATERFVYASNRGHNSIAMYKKLPDNTLESLGFEPTRGDFPRNFNITPDGKYLFCANQNSDNIVFFEIQNDGKLKYLKEIKVNTPVCIAFK